jgi:hypothetical protein
MSRKRDEKRDKERALARQLGVKRDDVPHALIAKPRTTSLILRPGKFIVDKRPTSLFSQKTNPFVVASLNICSPDGIHVVGAGVYRPGEEHDERGLLLPNDDVTAHMLKKVRVTHHRPAHIAICAALVAKESEARALADALARSSPRVLIDDVPRELGDDVIKRFIGTPGRACSFFDDGSLFSRARNRTAGWALFPAAGTGNHECLIPLSTDDNAWCTLAGFFLIE